MSGFLIHQSARPGNALRSLAPALEWFGAEKRVPIVGRVAEAGVSATKFGRRHSGSTGIAQDQAGWLMSAGSWSHPRCPANDNAALYALLRRRGEPILAELDGFYAIAWYTSETDTLSVVTDHIGRLHLFYALAPEGVFVSTSAVALARLVASEPDTVAVYEMLATGTIYEKRTPFRDIRRVPAASHYRFRRGVLFEQIDRGKLFAGEAAGARISTEEFAGVLEEALGVCVGGAANPLCDLTGGLDSRLVLGLLLRRGRAPAVTVTGRRGDPDVRVAAAIAHRLGIPITVADAAVLEDHQKDFANVLRAASLSEGGHDPVLYAAIEKIHSDHADQHDLSINGSGGELLRNYWWGRSDLGSDRRDIAAEGAGRFVRAALAPAIVAPEFRLDLPRHFNEVVLRCLDGMAGAAAHEQLDHLYLYLRMQCWQGSIGSATNHIWPAASPLLQRKALLAVSRLDPRSRLGARTMHRLYARFSRTLATHPLETGFPPLAPTLANWWRFAPGLMSAPRVLGHRLRMRRRAAGTGDRRETAMVRALFSSGAADYLDFPQMALRFCLDADEYARFLRAARETGDVPLILVGRLVALERVYRAAAGRA